MQYMHLMFLDITKLEYFKMVTKIITKIFLKMSAIFPNCHLNYHQNLETCIFPSFFNVFGHIIQS